MNESCETTQSNQKEITIPLKFRIWYHKFFYVIFIVIVFNHKAKQIFARICDFFVFFLEVFVIFPSVLSCNCLSIISNKNQTFNSTISTSPLYSGPKTRYIVIYVTKIKHWIKISRFSKLEFRGNKFRG